MVAGRLDGCLVGRLEQCILNGSVQDEVEPKLLWSLANSLEELSLSFFKCFM
jgi:hypothetical protein